MMNENRNATQIRPPIMNRIAKYVLFVQRALLTLAYAASTECSSTSTIPDHFLKKEICFLGDRFVIRMILFFFQCAGEHEFELIRILQGELQVHPRNFRDQFRGLIFEFLIYIQ